MKYTITAPKELMLQGNQEIVDVTFMGTNVRVIISGQNQGEINSPFRVVSDEIIPLSLFNQYILPALTTKF